MRPTGAIEYYYGTNGVAGFRYNNADYYYQKNLQGDVTAIYNTTGTKVAEYIYDAWGNCTVTLDTNNIGTLNPFRYRSYYYDTETSLYYLQTRYYDPEVGRFINPDDIEYLGINGNLINYNIFTYCSNNPICYIDSLGQWPKWLETVTKIVAVTTVVVATVLVAAGTGGAVAVIGLGAACGGLVGGFFNEKHGGSFTSGFLGGIVSGLVQGVAGYALGTLGIVVGGSIGSGLGTLIAGFLDNFFASPENRKAANELLTDAAKSAFIALLMSSLTGVINEGTQMVLSSELKALMPQLTEEFANMINAFFSGIDDAGTYIITGEMT